MRLFTTVLLLSLSHLLPAQCVTVAPIPNLCNGNLTYQLVASPSGGIWSGNQVSPSGLVNISNLFGFQFATYIYSDANCTDTVTVSYQVLSGPGVAAGTDFTIVCGNINYLVGAITPGPNNTGFWSTSDGHFVGSVTDMVTPIDRPGTYVLTAVSNSSGCSRRDTVVCYPYLPSFPNTQIEATICLGDTLLGYTSNGIYYEKYETGAACDSFRVVRLTVLPPLRDTVLSTICAGETVAGYDASGVYRDTFAALNGCDSIRVLDLTVLPDVATNLASTTCDPDQAGVFETVLMASNGCDSTVISTVTLLPTSNSSISATICADETFEGYNASGTYTDVFVNQFGCDSIRLLNLTVLPDVVTNLASTTCDPDQAGVFETVLTASNGCDSTVISTVTLLPTSNSSISATICAGETFEGYNASGTYTNVFVNQFGCDSVRVLNLTVLELPSVESKISADNGGGTGSITVTPLTGNQPFVYIWSTDDTTATISGLATGDYILTLTDAEGCSVTLIFTVPLSVGIFDPNSAPIQLLASPNPAGKAEMVGFSLTSTLSGKYFVSVFDATGRLIRQFEHVHFEPSSAFDLPFNEVGLYFIHLTDNRGRRIQVKVAVGL